ncbi:hypothetical protein AJ79_03997 [Helicocarpus griseus UAMH5409]|uniref:Uncharacterized protein n=1 Tax=Helicocarpus griseus UAMH5409 TaxID=1447875 RepID=A0A2B7XWL2_9EURO|nr:hypothetical protein AJ79_03997 [Helicocarpus griseus UAMH5409]
MATVKADKQAAEPTEYPFPSTQKLHDDFDSRTNNSLSPWPTQEESLPSSPNACRLAPPSPASSEFDPSRGAKPCSPFYTHPTTRTSLEQLRTEGQQYKMHDVENGYQVKPSMDGQGSDRGLWGHNSRKKSKWLGKLSRKQRFAVKALIAVVIVGAMVGIGLGISVALGTGVWKSNHQSEEIRRP